MNTVQPMTVGKLRPGMILAQDVLTEQGQILLVNGMTLTQEWIDKLGVWGIHSAAVRIDVGHETAQQRETAVFSENYGRSMRLVRTAFETARYRNQIPHEDFELAADGCFQMLTKTRGLVSLLNGVRDFDDYTFQHSVNVGILSGLLAKWAGLAEAVQRDYIMAGLLHDIGKTRIPAGILNKPAALAKDEMSFMRKHAQLGLGLVERTGIVSQTVLQGIEQHHERLDGSGYPLGRTGEQIPQAARVVAVADMYDAMTSNRVYRRAISPFHAVETLRAEMYDRLDPEICSLFLQNIYDHLLGSVVLLNNGISAKIVYVDKERHTQPVVLTEQGVCIDLSRQESLKIAEIMAN